MDFCVPIESLTGCLTLKAMNLCTLWSVSIYRHQWCKLLFIDGFLLLTLYVVCILNDKITDCMSKNCFKKAFILLSITFTCHQVDC